MITCPLAILKGFAPSCVAQPFEKRRRIHAGRAKEVEVLGDSVAELQRQPRAACQYPTAELGGPAAVQGGQDLAQGDPMLKGW